MSKDLEENSPKLPVRKSSAGDSAAKDFRTAGPSSRDIEDLTLASALLAALNAVASRNRRLQADVDAALNYAGLQLDRARLVAAIRVLIARGCLADPVPLSDGGLLIRVVRSALEEPTSPWMPE